MGWFPKAALKVCAQANNVLDRSYSSASQLAATGFGAAENFIARPFAGPAIDGELPQQQVTFYSPGAPRSFWVGLRYAFLTG